MTLRIAIGIPTFRRPEQLAALLRVLPARIRELEAVADAVVDVLVVDNDPLASARAVSHSAPLVVTYAVEATPGIAAARNRLLDAAAGADALAFLDDDELPRHGWLAALVATWRATGAAAVMGRVVAVFDGEPDPWLIATGVYRRRSRPTGLTLHAAATGNLLLDLASVRAARVRFDPTIGLAGGEDTLFTKQLVRAGGRIVWCDASLADDAVPAERMTRAWAMQRAFNGGNAAVHVALRLAARAPERLAVRSMGLVGGAARACLGWMRHAAGRATGRLEHDARGLRTAYRGLGMLAAAVGHTHVAYAREARR